MRFRKFLKPYKTRDSSFREYTSIQRGDRVDNRGRVYKDIYLHEKAVRH